MLFSVAIYLFEANIHILENSNQRAICVGDNLKNHLRNPMCTCEKMF